MAASAVDLSEVVAVAVTAETAETTETTETDGEGGRLNPLEILVSGFLSSTDMLI